MDRLRHFIDTLKDKLHPVSRRLEDLYYLLPERFRSRRLLTIAGLSLLALLLVFAGYKIFGKKKAVQEEAELVQVKVKKAARENFTDTYAVMGTIKGAVENELRFEIDGVLARFNYKEGDRIPRGRTICSLDPKDSFTRADFARSKYSSEQSSYYSASQRLKVYEELFRMKAISESKLQEARYETMSAEARMKAALSELELAQSNLAKTNLTAPADGLLAELIIKPGEYITPQDVVAKFISGGSTNFEVDVPEKDVNKLKIGQKVKINCDSYPGVDFMGTLAEIAPTVKERTRTSTVKISIDNNDGKLRSGMFGRGTIFLVEMQNAMLVPSDSVISLGEKSFLVPLVKPDPRVPGEGAIEMRHVTLGDKLTQKTVIQDGIMPGEMVVIETQGQLADGMKIKFIEALEEKLGSGMENEDENSVPDALQRAPSAP